ncbi:putative disease resistance RPP13-like protein 1 [Rutidosis leptorrhynchoides]|uniref:putative disease resistance RPP13-like protein 1 n=1 Tax=Rutidosis leptorrhynchoides TaxID=125765 RepID=UPI003A98F281
MAKNNGFKTYRVNTILILHVIAIQETKCCLVTYSWIENLWRSPDFSFIQKEAMGFSGVLTATVTVLLEKLLSGGLIKLTGFEGIESQLKDLQTTWKFIDAVLADASKKQITDRSVNVWVHDPRGVAYDMEDVLDDMATETMRRNFNDESHGTGEVSVFNIIPNFLTNMADIADNFMYDQEKLLNKLLGDEACNQNVSIISIVGLGGVGKITLAQLLYNNGKVIDEFDLKRWVCVSEEFDVLTISNKIYQAVTGENKNFVNLDQLHVALQERLLNKRFLLVLDDVWNEDQDKWDVLEKPRKGAPGSKIIVTTRKTKVSKVMNCAEPYVLGILSVNDALSLLAKSALDEPNFHKHLSLISVARLITEKCKGLPLALIAIGRVLKGKGNDEYEWDKLLKSEIWSSNDSILPALN